MLSEKEREFLRDVIDLNNPPFGSGAEAAQKENQFREKWSYGYEKVLWFRIKQKYMRLFHDLWLIQNTLSKYERRGLAYNFMVGENRPPEREAQGINDLWDLVNKDNP